ncbi:MAG: hypothetical protein AAGK05_18680 [Pseudomonadota bacterium]
MDISFLLLQRVAALFAISFAVTEFQGSKRCSIFGFVLLEKVIFQMPQAVPNSPLDNDQNSRHCFCSLQHCKIIIARQKTPSNFTSLLKIASKNKQASLHAKWISELENGIFCFDISRPFSILLGLDGACIAGIYWSGARLLMSGCPS